jgi:ADP-heptose:LPS heptosyltransferase
MGSENLKNILFIRSDRLGEFLLNLAAIKLVKLNYPGSRISLLAKKENLELIRGIDFVDSFIEYQEDDFSGYSGAFKLAKLFKKEAIDCVICLNPKKEFHLAAFLAKIPLRVGYSRKWAFCLNKKIEDRKFLAEKHEAEYNLDLIKFICKNIFIPAVKLAVDNPESLGFLKDEIELGKNYIIIHPFTSNPAKKIEDTFWINLTKEIENKCRKDILLVGSSAEKEESQDFSRQIKAKNLTGRLSLRNLATLLKYNCSVFIGLDSGPMHLAALLRKPVVGLFTVSNPKRWSPFHPNSLVIKIDSSEYLMHKIEDIVKFTCSNLESKI